MKIISWSVKQLIDAVREGNINSEIDIQREIIYKPVKQVKVIDSILADVPLPAFYFWEKEKGKYEVLDGRQRIEGMKKFIEGNLENEWIDENPNVPTNTLFRNLPTELRDKINNTKLSIIVCEGNEELKRKIFDRINTLGVPLSKFEVLNGLYNGEYVRGLKSYVKNLPNLKSDIGKTGDRGGAELFILTQLALCSKSSVEDFLERQQNKSFNVDKEQWEKLYKFFKEIFGEITKDISFFFNIIRNNLSKKNIWIDKKDDIQRKVLEFMNNKNEYKLCENKEDKYWQIIHSLVGDVELDKKRFFTKEERLYVFNKYKEKTGVNKDKYQCPMCQKYFSFNELVGDHFKAHTKAGKTDSDNLQLLCANCNSKKGKK